MRKAMCVVTCVAFMVLTWRTAEAHSRYPYLVEATNRMLALNALGERVTASEAAAAAKQACDALGILAKDQQFASDLRKWEKDQFTDERLTFKRDLGLFVDAFLVPEKAILEYADLDDNARQRILMSAAAVHASIDVKINPEQILTNLERLRSYICGTAARLLGVPRQQELIQEIRRLGLGLVAVALITADVPFAAAGPPAVVAALSAAAGTILLDRAVGDILARQAK